MNDSTTTSAILAGAAALCIAVWAALKTYWNLREIVRGHSQNTSRQR